MKRSYVHSNLWLESKQSRDEKLEKLSAANDKSISIIREELWLAENKTDRAHKLNQIINDYGCTLPTARYILGQLKKGLSYKPRPKKGLKFNNISEKYILRFYSNTCDVINRKTGRTLKPFKMYQRSRQDKGDYSTHYHWMIAIRYENKNKIVSLASLIYMYVNEIDIPDGYIVDHIDNSPDNNSIDNLQLITLGTNIKKNKNRRCK